MATDGTDLEFERDQEKHENQHDIASLVPAMEHSDPAAQVVELDQTNQVSEMDLPPPPPPPPPVLDITSTQQKPPERGQSSGRKKPKELQFEIVRAIEREDISAVRQLIDEGTQLDCIIVFNKTPLTLAIEKESFAMAKLMVQSGADVNFGEPYANAHQPLHVAVKVGSYDMTEYLLQNGADVNGRNGCGMTPVMFASHSGQLNIVEMLHAHGADLDAGDYVGKTSLHRAAEGQHASIVQFLLRKGVNINAMDKFRRTALYHSVTCRHLDMIDLLVASGISVTGMDLFHLTLLYVTVRGACKGNIQAILSTGVDYHKRLKRVPIAEVREAIRTRDNEMMLHVDFAILQLLVNNGAVQDFSNINAFFDNLPYEETDDFRVPLWHYLIVCNRACKPERLSNQVMSMLRLSVTRNCMENSWSLQLLCRLAVRRDLGRQQPCDIHASVNKLPIPNALKNFLNLSDFFNVYPQLSPLYTLLD